MSMGRPIVTTNVSGCRETVIDGYNGFLVDVKNPIAAAEGFNKMLTTETRRTFGLNSRKYCEEKFDSRIVNKTILSAMNLISL
jgi:glycosyltransferase involved in cell wall biosynthesis